MSKLYERKCETCEYFGGERTIKNDKVISYDKGICTCKGSYYFRRDVDGGNRNCSYYKQWSVAKQVEEEEKEKWHQERLERIEKNIQKQQEYRRWYNSLSPEEKAAHDEKRKKYSKAVLIIIFAIILIVFYLVIKKSETELKEFKLSPTNKIITYINEKSKDGIYNTSLSESGLMVNISIQYDKNGWHYESEKYADFKVEAKTEVNNGSGVNSIVATMLFNLDGSESKSSFSEGQSPFYKANLIYDNGSVLIEYRGTGIKNNLPYYSYCNTYYSNSWTGNKDKPTEDDANLAFLLCQLTYAWTKELYGNVVGTNIIK